MLMIFALRVQRDSIKTTRTPHPATHVPLILSTMWRVPKRAIPALLANTPILRLLIAPNENVSPLTRLILFLTLQTACDEDDYEYFYTPCEDGKRTLVYSWITPVVSYTE